MSNVSEIGLTSLLYVSRSTLDVNGDQASVGEIVSEAIERNKLLLVTGALFYTGLHFAQFLEGPRRSVESLMASISKDTRHHHVTVVAHKQVPRRRFPEWAMAYAGSNPFLDRQMKALLSPLTAEPERCRLMSELGEDAERRLGAAALQGR
ncbi:BLUF domain-containing protein [Novosphingobium sp. Gsoil 351]|uniref:BLUF domain-containing protein n=1 Tax=Novosphingobium sp. Gsoil 351 TaxID=2675225 RepID=UPI0012B4A92D|nr:BLUF domain-containing protein [Novosphingobium sp. Gsoil 351]QGN55787.1 blue light sensor protein [Novosphingobium sp. Gsoil 351]